MSDPIDRAFNIFFGTAIVLVVVAAVIAVYADFFGGESNWEKCRGMSTDEAKVECMDSLEGGSDDQ